MPTQTTSLNVTVNAQRAISSLNGLQSKLSSLGASGDSLSGKINGLGGSIVAAFSNLNPLTKFGLALGAITAGFVALTFGLREFVSDLTMFQVQMAEVSTLVDTAEVNIAKLSQEVRNLAVEFGADTGESAQALYQIISSGAEASTEAIEVLTVANKLAVGGVTNVAVAADGLTSFMNAYTQSGITATEVSDALFVAMRGGKTTVEELSLALGQPAPIAATLGVSFDELAGSISAITTGGISTRIASFQIKSLLEGILKPTTSAAAAAKELGLEWSVAGIRAKGLEQFLQEVTEATGGNIDVLSELFPNTRSLQAALSLTGAQADTFADIMENMRNKTGETDVAFQKLSVQFDFEWERMLTIFREIGKTIQEIVLPAVTVLTRWMTALAESTLRFIQRLRGIDTRTLEELLSRQRFLQSELERRPDGRLADNYRRELDQINRLIDLQRNLNGVTADSVDTWEIVDNSVDEVTDSVDELGDSINGAANELTGLQKAIESIKTDSQIAQELKDQIDAINQLEQQGQISSERASRLRVDAAQNTNRQLGTPDSQSVVDPVSNRPLIIGGDRDNNALVGFEENFVGSLERMRENVDDLGGTIGKSFAGAFEQATTSFSMATTEALLSGESLGDGLKNVVANFGRTVLQTLIQIAVQALIVRSIAGIGGGFGGFGGLGTNPIPGSSFGVVPNAAGFVGGFASGGFVSGPGGPTSDMVPALLSNGEFVVNAKATKQYQGLLENINNNRNLIPKFQSGGLVSPGAGANNRVNASVPQITIENRTSANINSAEARRSEDGRIIVVIREAIEGGLFDDSLGVFGANRVPER